MLFTEEIKIFATFEKGSALICGVILSIQMLTAIIDTPKINF